MAAAARRKAAEEKSPGTLQSRGLYVWLAGIFMSLKLS